MSRARQSLPRPEHPRPQFQRDDWINLNGPWTYDFDFGVQPRLRETSQRRARCHPAHAES